MKNLILFGLLLLSPPAFSQLNPFDTLKYDCVVAYEFNGEGGMTIEYYMKNKPSKIDLLEQLSAQQIEKFEKIITSRTAFGNNTASCFDPHFAVVYYQKDKIVATVDVCLDCNYLDSSLNIPSESFKMFKISDDYSYPAKGFSKSTRKAIREFCKELGFIRYLSPKESMFD